jgi:Gram-negative bacterial TonB protein C-terminal
MKFRSYITDKSVSNWQSTVGHLVVIILFVVCCFSPTIFAQKFAVITPESSSISEKISTELSDKLNALDSDLVQTAFRSTTYENIYNLTTSEAKTIGSAIGCDYFILLKTDTWQRNSFDKGEYFESYAVVYVVNSKTGHLIFWKLYGFEDKKSSLAELKLFTQINLISAQIRINLADSETNKTNIKEYSEDDKTLRSPLPYKRIKPAYTTIASFHSVAATVDIEVDLNEKGEVTRTEIVRWAGFGLNESVIETVKKMNWRQALKDGKPIPIRILLRYNFKKLDKDL